MSTQAERDQIYAQRRDHCPRLVSDGDSWFDYPIHTNLIDWITTRTRYAILRFEQSGETLQEIAGAARYRGALLTEHPLALLISGGGNDLARDWWLKGLFTNPAGSTDPAACVSAPDWAQRRSALKQGYLDILGSAGTVPVFGHGYDYFIPLDAPVRVAGFALTGPWFFPAMHAAGITSPELQRGVARRLVDDFNQVLAELAAEQPRFHHVDLRGTLVDSDWVNEIHPSRWGFRKVADRFIAQLRPLVGS